MAGKDPSRFGKEGWQYGESNRYQRIFIAEKPLKFVENDRHFSTLMAVDGAFGTDCGDLIDRYRTVQSLLGGKDPTCFELTPPEFRRLGLRKARQAIPANRR